MKTVRYTGPNSHISLPDGIRQLETDCTIEVDDDTAEALAKSERFTIDGTTDTVIAEPAPKKKSTRKKTSRKKS